MKSKRRIHSLQLQMILSFLFAVILTAALVGLPAIWLIRQQLDQQAWSQVEQGQRAVRSLYAAMQDQMQDHARLTAQRPTLQRLVEQGDVEGLQEYLPALQSGEGVDLILICDSGGEVVAFTGSPNVHNGCEMVGPQASFAISAQVPPQVWLMASYPLDAAGGHASDVVSGRLLDRMFASQIRDQSGLEHTILVNGVAVASSYSGTPVNLTTVEPGVGVIATPPAGVCCTYEVADSPYYAVRESLPEPGLEVEVALPVANITATQQRLYWFFGLSMAGVVLVGSAIGVILARRISQPLVSLAQSAEKISTGDLSTAVTIDSNINEVVQLSQALESARVDLSRTLGDLQSEKAWIDHLLESIVEGIITLDENCRITFFSHGAEQITGWNREEVIGRTCDEVFQLSGAGMRFSQSLPAVGQRNRILVKLPEDREATLSITQARLSPSGSGEGEVAIVFRDVSETEALRRLLGYFLANITHEFRTPLSALAASIELLMDQAPDLTPAEMDELLKSLHLGVLSLQRLIDNLLESASIEAGHFRVSARPHDIRAIIDDAVTTMHPLLDRYNQQLVIDFEPELPEVMADPRRVIQVVSNLLSNASKYGPADEKIHLSARVEGDFVHVEVADRGPGISTRHRDLLFRRFEYPATANPDFKAGAGLGLSVVKAIVDAHGGIAQVENRPGGGSIFWFTLPVARDI